MCDTGPSNRADEFDTPSLTTQQRDTIFIRKAYHIKRRRQQTVIHPHQLRQIYKDELQPDFVAANEIATFARSKGVRGGAVFLPLIDTVEEALSDEVRDAIEKILWTERYAQYLTAVRELVERSIFFVADSEPSTVRWSN